MSQALQRWAAAWACARISAEYSVTSLTHLLARCFPMFFRYRDISAHTRTHAQTDTHRHTHTQRRTHTHIHTRTHTHPHPHPHPHAHAHAHADSHTCDGHTERQTDRQTDTQTDGQQRKKLVLGVADVPGWAMAPNADHVCPPSAKMILQGCCHVGATAFRHPSSHSRTTT